MLSRIQIKNHREEPQIKNEKLPNVMGKNHGDKPRLKIKRKNHREELKFKYSNDLFSSNVRSFPLVHWSQDDVFQRYNHKRCTCEKGELQ